MNPFCPVCRKRVETKPLSYVAGYWGAEEEFERHAVLAPNMVCQCCGTVFLPTISERLAPKCRSCGETYSEDPDWRSKISFVEIPIVAGLCGKCTDEALGKSRKERP